MAKQKALAGCAVVFAVLCVLVATCHAQIKCKNERGTTADWWVALKYPDSRNYAYADTSSSALKNSTNTFASSSSTTALSATLSQLYQGLKTVSYVFYSDQPPTKKREIEGDKAHSKGVLAVDDNGSGFWLIHSTPLFPKGPSSSSKFAYMEDSQVNNGQNFLCVTFNGWSAFQNIGAQLLTVRPDIYDSKLTSKATKSAANLKSLVDGQYVKTGLTSIKTITSAGGTQFRSFAKSGYYPRGTDLWDEFVAPNLRNSLLVQTWRNGAGGPMPNNCTAKYKVNNVENMNLLKVEWKATTDHSKWAVSSSSTWYCGGDVNRMDSQGDRGGGALCFQNSKLSSSVRSALSSTKC